MHNRFGVRCETAKYQGYSNEVEKQAVLEAQLTTDNHKQKSIFIEQLLVSQSHHRIKMHCAPRCKVTSEQCCSTEGDQDDRIRQRIVRADTVKLCSDKVREWNCSKESKHDACSNQAKTLAHDHLQNPKAACAKRYPHSYLTRA